MQSAVNGVVPVFCGDDMGKSVGMVVDNALGHPGGAGGEVEQHGVVDAGLYPLELIGGCFQLFREIHKAVDDCSYGPEPAIGTCLLNGIKGTFADISLVGADKGLDVGTVDAVNVVLSREHMGNGNSHSSYLVQGNNGYPVFIMPFQGKDDSVSSAYAMVFKDVCCLIAEKAQLSEGEYPFISLGIAPDHSSLVRLEPCVFVNDVISEVEILGIFQPERAETAVRGKALRAEILVNVHVYSFNLLRLSF